MEDENEFTGQLPLGVGERLHAAREARKLSLEQVAAETRIPQRHLIAIEAGDFARLPGRTYAVGFARTYAKMLGLDQDDIAAGVGGGVGAPSRSEPAPDEPLLEPPLQPAASRMVRTTAIARIRRNASG
jgi:cytoskeletal protein RodZ